MNRESTATCTITIGGLETDVCVLFTVTSWGAPGTWEDPPEPPEFDITDVRYDDESGRSIYDLCDTTRDLWGPAVYAGGYWQIQHGPGMAKAGWRSVELDGPRSYPAYCRIGFNSPWGTNRTLLDSLYEQVADNHLPDLERSDYDWDPRDD
jgi:hypothetical protein